MTAVLQRTSLLALAAAFPIVADAHAAKGAAWTLDPWVLIPLLAAALLFIVGAVRVLERSTVRIVHARHALWFALGWLSLALALVSPLHAAGERSFAAHMLEHEILMLVAAPLIVLGRPLGFFAWALPLAVRRASGRVERDDAVSRLWAALTAPVFATLLQAVALWLWHVPALFDLAVENSGWHIVQHLSFLVSSLLFWTSLLDAHRMRRRPAVVIGCLFATALISGALGALMAVSWSPWYAAYASLGETSWGLTPVEDQQLAGLLMWIPGGAVHAGAALAIMAGMLRPSRSRLARTPARDSEHAPT